MPTITKSDAYSTLVGCIESYEAAGEAIPVRVTVAKALADLGDYAWLAVPQTPTEALQERLVLLTSMDDPSSAVAPVPTLPSGAPILPDNSAAVAAVKARAAPVATNRPSEKQIDFIKSLIADIAALDATQGEVARAALNAGWVDGTLTKSTASARIDALIKERDRLRTNRPAQGKTTVQATPATTDVPEGRFAVTADAGHTIFVQVDKPSKGKWEGRTFVSLLVGHPGDWFKQAMKGAQGQALLAKIQADGPEAAMARYGHEHGRCGACESPLSDPVSIARGIGPVCASKRGW